MTTSTRHRVTERPATDTWAWLRGNPSADELRSRFPRDWAAVETKLAALLEERDVAALEAFASSVRRPVNAGTGNAALSAEVRRQIAVRQLRRLNQSLSTGVATGTVRFNRRNGWIIQRLFFRRGLERKPVSMFWYRTMWPRLRQRRFLMPLVTPKGIYCFYSGDLVRGLAEIIGDRPALEIAAGDGTLTRFLRNVGVNIEATDDHSWAANVSYDGVERQSATASLRTRRPTVVVCSWPPNGNDFEKHVFLTSSVDIYIVIGSRQEHAAGSWPAYRRQRTFDVSEAEQLSRLVLPEELEPAVFVFRRRQPATASEATA